MRIFLILMAALAIAGCKNPAPESTQGVSSGKISSPLLLGIEPENEVIPGRVVDIAVSVGSRSPLPQVALEVDLPEGLAVYSGEREWRGSLAAGERHKEVFAVRVPHEGRHVIRARAEARVNESMQFSSRARYVLGGGDDETERADDGSEVLDHPGGPIREFRLE